MVCKIDLGPGEEATTTTTTATITATTTAREELTKFKLRGPTMRRRQCCLIRLISFRFLFDSLFLPFSLSLSVAA